MWLRGPIEDQAVHRALARVAQAATTYRHAICPRPFGQLRAAICAAKVAGARCDEIALILSQGQELGAQGKDDTCISPS